MSVARTAEFTNYSLTQNGRSLTREVLACGVMLRSLKIIAGSGWGS